MCMFQDNQLKPSNLEEVAYKVLYVTYTGKVVTPYQHLPVRLDRWMRATRDGNRKWDIDLNPGFGVFKTELGAKSICYGDRRIIVKVRVRRVVTRGIVSGGMAGRYAISGIAGCCAMEMFVASKGNPRLMSKIKEVKEKDREWAKKLKRATT